MARPNIQKRVSIPNENTFFWESSRKQNQGKSNENMRNSHGVEIQVGNPYGGGPFVLRPELYDAKLTTGKTGSILCLRSKINSFLAIQTLPVFPVVIFSALA